MKLEIQESKKNQLIYVWIIPNKLDEFNMAVKNDFSFKKKSTNETIQHGMNMYEKVQKPVSKKKPQSSGNFSSVQDILNETRKTLEESSYTENEFRFTSNDVHAFAQPHSAIPSGMNASDVAPEVVKALTRDYSALMAKINEKTGS